VDFLNFSIADLSHLAFDKRANPAAVRLAEQTREPRRALKYWHHPMIRIRGINHVE
jgi:hypothetical protein